MNIDFEKLREDLKQDSYGAFFIGGFGGAIFESFDIDKASHEELLDLAEQKGININKYKGR